VTEKDNENYDSNLVPPGCCWTYHLCKCQWGQPVLATLWTSLSQDKNVSGKNASHAFLLQKLGL